MTWGYVEKVQSSGIRGWGNLRGSRSTVGLLGIQGMSPCSLYTHGGLRAGHRGHAQALPGPALLRPYAHLPSQKEGRVEP